MKKLDEDLEKLLMSLNDDERRWFGSNYYHPIFPSKLSVVLIMRGWELEDIMNMVKKAREVIPENVTN